MRYFITLLLFVFVYTIPTFSQDTSYLYFNKGWEECKKDTAFYYGVLYKTGDLWSRKDFWVKGNKLQMEASYRDKECKTGEGTFKWYNENGSLRNTSQYENGKIKTADYFYDSGKKRGHINYTANGSIQTGWDENGNEIPNYVVEKEAVFPGGLEGWRTYLEQNLNAGVAGKSKVGVYTVKVQFIVDKEGNISNVHTIDVPAGCKPCGREAVRIIKSGPNWEPAIQYNKRVIYQAIQHVTFQVAEE